MLGSAQDPKLAQRALELTLTQEVEAINRPELLDSVARRHAQMAFDFAAQHRDQVNAWLGTEDRDFFQAALLGRATDPTALAELDAYVTAHIPASARLPIEALKAQLAYRMKVRAERLPQVDAWLKSHD